MGFSEQELANKLGRWKARKIPDEELGFLSKVLAFLKIERLETELECELEGCVLTRGKYNGWRSFINQIREGIADPSDFDRGNVYEILQQWKTDKNFTVSAIIWRKSGDPDFNLNELQDGQTIKITRYGCVWHPFHKWGLMLNSFLYCKKFLNIGSSVEVYPQSWE